MHIYSTLNIFIIRQHEVKHTRTQNCCPHTNHVSRGSTYK